MGDDVTIHCKSVGVDLKKRNFSIEYLMPSNACPELLTGNGKIYH